MSNEENKLSHSVWEGKYHIVWIPKTGANACTKIGAVTWVRYFGPWPSNGNVILWKGMFALTMRIC